MKIINCTQADIKKALIVVNSQYQDNIEFKKLKSLYEGFAVQLVVKDTSKKGTRYSLMPKENNGRIPSNNACWHVHNAFWSALLDINSEAVILNKNRPIFSKHEEKIGLNEKFIVGSNRIPINLLCKCEEKNVCDNKEINLSRDGKHNLFVVENEFTFYTRSEVNGKFIKGNIDWEAVKIAKERFDIDIVFHNAKVLPSHIGAKYTQKIKEYLKEK